MKKQEWQEGLSHLDPSLVEEYVIQKDALAVKRRRKAVLCSVGAVATCLLLVATLVVIPLLRGMFDKPPVIPTIEGAVYSANELAALMQADLYDSVATNAYTEVEVSSSVYLNLGTLFDGEYLKLYHYESDPQGEDKKALKKIEKHCIPNIVEAIGGEMSQSDKRSIDTPNGEHYLLVSQRDGATQVVLRNRSVEESIFLYGERIEIDQRQSNEEIIASLGSIREKLCDVFDVSFSDAKVTREFDSWSQHGAARIDVYFYNESDHPLNAVQDVPISDYVMVSFENRNNTSDAIVSDDVLARATVYYRQHRKSAEEEYSPYAYAKKITLQEAEALLYQGYVFGNHVCEICMAAQDKVSFEDYDYVEMEYLFLDGDTNNLPKVGIPFYVFYKKLRETPYGIQIYAKTHVAAIEISDYDSYFAEQQKNHRERFAAG